MSAFISCVSDVEDLMNKLSVYKLIGLLGNLLQSGSSMTIIITIHLILDNPLTSEQWNSRVHIVQLPYLIYIPILYFRFFFSYQSL